MKLVPLTQHESKTLPLGKESKVCAMSGNFCITQSEAKIGVEGFQVVRFQFDGTDGQSLNGSMTLTTDQFPNGPALLLVVRCGKDMSLLAVISMGSRAWAYSPLDEVSLMRDSLRMRRLTEPLLLTALGPMAQIGWRMWADLFANRNRELAEITDCLHSFLHRVARNADQYWESSTLSAGKL